MTPVEPSSRNEQSWLKGKCLERDGYRCVVAESVDYAWARAHRQAYPSGTDIEVITDCAHILPFSLGSFEDASSLEVENVGIIWAALFRYFPAIEGQINAGMINCLENALTLSSNLHLYFGMFTLAFEQTVIRL